MKRSIAMAAALAMTGITVLPARAQIADPAVVAELDKLTPAGTAECLSVAAEKGIAYAEDGKVICMKQIPNVLLRLDNMPSGNASLKCYVGSLAQRPGALTAGFGILPSGQVTLILDSAELKSRGPSPSGLNLSVPVTAKIKGVVAALQKACM